jgi:hypothetical protein
MFTIITSLPFQFHWTDLDWGSEILQEQHDQNEFGMEAVEKPEELLKQVCKFVFVH